MSGFRSIGAFVVGLGFGASLVWLAVSEKSDVRMDRESVGQPRAKRLLVERKGVERSIGAEEDRRLAERIAEVEKELRAAHADGKSSETKVEESSRRPLSYGEWFALQRKADPVRYAQLTNGIVRSQRRVIGDYALRVDLLDTVDVSAFAPKDASVHADYRDALARIADLRRDELARRCVAPDMKVENSPEWQRQLKEAAQLVHELQPRERFLLLGEAGRLHGLNRRDAEELAETLHLIIETTSSSKRYLKPERESLTL